jgi:hypothetical protein
MIPGNNLLFSLDNLLLVWAIEKIKDSRFTKSINHHLAIRRRHPDLPDLAVDPPPRPPLPQFPRVGLPRQLPTTPLFSGMPRSQPAGRTGPCRRASFGAPDPGSVMTESGNFLFEEPELHDAVSPTSPPSEASMIACARSA